MAARVLAPYLAKYTVAANVAIENNAKAGGLVAVNQVYNVPKADGLTLVYRFIKKGTLSLTRRGIGCKVMDDAHQVETNAFAPVR